MIENEVLLRRAYSSVTKKMTELSDKLRMWTMSPEDAAELRAEYRKYADVHDRLKEKLK